MPTDLERSSVSTTCLATQKSILWNGELVPKWSRWRVDTEVELLSEILSSPKLRSHIPHPYVIEGDVNCSPRIRVYLHQTPSSGYLNIGFMGQKAIRELKLDAHLSRATSYCVPKIVLASARLCPLASIHAENRTLSEIEFSNHRLIIKYQHIVRYVSVIRRAYPTTKKE